MTRVAAGPRMSLTACLFAAACALAILPGVLLAQQVSPLETGYQLPPKVIVDILDAPPPPTAIVSPSRNMMALLDRRSMPPVAELAEPMLRLAGNRINPKTNGMHNPATGLGITLKQIPDGKEMRVVLPQGLRPGMPTFSPDGKRLSFLVYRSAGIDLWMADVATAQARLVATDVNGIGGCAWLNDSSAMLCQLVPAGRGQAPASPLVPTGPRIQENIGKAAPVSTYQDLLTSAHDEKLYDYYFTAQLSIVTPAGIKTIVGKAGRFATVSASPDGRFILVARTKRPYSRLIPDSQFPKDIEVWNRAGDVVRRIGEQPLGEAIPIGGVTAGPRSYRWNAAEPSTLVWTEALDEGDTRKTVPNRDRIVSLEAPFAGEPVEVMRTASRFQAISWTEKGTALVAETDRATRMSRTWIVEPGAASRKLWERRSEDRYGDPGSPIDRSGTAAGGRGGGSGRPIIQSGDFIYLTGAGASPQGDRPFLSRLNLKTLAVDKLFQCDDRSYEAVAALLSDDGKQVLTRWETKTDFPNYYVRDLGTGARTMLTQFKDPAPQLTGIEKQLVTYDRKDGVKLSATVYLPPGYKPGTKLPFVLWAYPAEFTDAAAASQVSGSPNRFTTISGASHLLFLTQGYGVMDNPTMPIIGPGETANDTYVDQLVASAEAAIDKIVAMGVADRDRIGVAGHSYGAFMTANLLAHSRLFRAGAARSGAYNRSLTPFGFQNEQRTFWEVPAIYSRMSPFWFADKVEDPILLIHGEADNNSGTFPIQSERFYMALKGNGKTVRYVTLPLEAHGYAARESNLHVLYEWINWFDKYVKNAKPRS